MLGWAELKTLLVRVVTSERNIGVESCDAVYCFDPWRHVGCGTVSEDTLVDNAVFVSGGLLSWTLTQPWTGVSCWEGHVVTPSSPGFVHQRN